jgi:gamma-glutamyltranspeptidase/glutathione hydrolase
MAKPCWVVQLGVACGALLFATATALAQGAPLQPESISAARIKPGWKIKSFAIAAANPLAAQAGYQMLRRGGSAVDAAIAAQMVLALVEPQSSGLGGGAFLLHFDGQRVQAYDGRETAPAGATESLFLDANKRPLPFIDAVVGGRAVGVPGTVSMLALAHSAHGKLPWAVLFRPAIRLASKGFRVSERMATLLAGEQYLQRDPVARAYFYDSDGHPWRQGHLLRNPELAAILQRIARNGPHALMTGALADAIVAKVQGHATNPGSLSLQDLNTYRPMVREPLCFPFDVPQRSRSYRVCGMPAPASGTLAMGQILGILAHTPAQTLAPGPQGLPGAQWLHLYTEASRLAFADRAQYLGDPQYVVAPLGQWSSLLQEDYLRQRAALIDSTDSGKSMGSAAPGQPGQQDIGWAPMPQQTESGTSHLSVLDRYGNALAMTTTIEDAWGSRQMVNRGVGLSGGFLLNNELTDFSFLPADESGKPIANRVEPGKRPRSSMSPTLVFDQNSGKLVMSLGSPGGPLIIHFTTKTLYAVLVWGLNAQQAVNLPNFGSLNGPTLLEQERFDAATLQELRQRGHSVTQFAMPSGVQAIVRSAQGWSGAADPRREGVVRGD